MKASVDPEFRKVLLEKRSDAATLIDLELSPAEASMLEAVPREQLERIIDHTTVPEEHRRVFLGKIGCLMLALLGAGAALLLLTSALAPVQKTFCYGLCADPPDPRHGRVRKEPRRSKDGDMGPENSPDDRR